MINQSLKRMFFYMAAVSLAACLAAVDYGCKSRDVLIDGGTDAGYAYHSFERIGSFSNGLAPVRLGGKWGFIDTSGNLIIAPESDNIRSFVDEEYTAVKKGALWQIISGNGTKVTTSARFSDIGKFSQGLARALGSIRGKYGYIDTTGNYVISPQFDMADTFAMDLAPVKKDGKWSYILKDGSIAFSMNFYRAYPFSRDGLALVLTDKNGKYGYIGVDGQLKIPANFLEAAAFQERMAPVREGSLWGYIDTAGNYRITPSFKWADKFSGGLAVVQDNNGFKYINPDGQPAIPGPFDKALQFGSGLGVVTKSGRTYVIDGNGNDTKIAYAYATAKTALASGALGSPDQCDEASTQAIVTFSQGGLAMLQFFNYTDYTWTLSNLNVETPQNWDVPSTVFIPGIPAQLQPITDPLSGGVTQFIVKYTEQANFATQSATTPYFQMTLTATDPITQNNYSFTLAGTDYFQAASPDPSHPWWGVFIDAAGWLKSGFDLAVGDPWALVDLSISTYDLVSGIVDDSSTPSNPNPNPNTADLLSTMLTGTVNTVAMASLNGGLCGGDTYSISDNKTLVIQMNSAKSGLAPPQIQIQLMSFGQYFAQNAITEMDAWRQEGSYNNFPYTCIYQMAFNNYADTDDSSMCENDGGYSYINTATNLTNNINANDPLDWWAFANSLEVSATDPIQTQRWIMKFNNYCGNSPVPGCPYSSAYYVGGQISGLLPNESIIIQNNGSNNLTLTSNGIFVFPGQVVNGTEYNVTIKQQPQTQTCVVLGGSGIVSGSDVFSITVNCHYFNRIYVTSTPYSGQIGGLAGADASCMSDPSYPGSGTFKAMLVADNGSRRACSTANCSGGSTENVDWVLKPGVNYARLDGTPISTANEAGILPFPLTNTFRNGPDQFWTGLNGNWTTMSGTTCNSWTASEGGWEGQGGDAQQTDQNSISENTYTCNSTLGLLCVEQ